jgi:hypothetical protein
MKIRHVEANLFHADGRTNSRTQTDITSLTNHFRSFAKAPRRNKYEVASDYNFIDASVEFHSLLHTLPRKHKHTTMQ